MATRTVQSRTSWRRVLVLAFAAIVTITVASVFLRGRNPTPQETSVPLSDSGLVVAPDRLNFGEVWEDSRFIWKLVLENPLDRDVEVQNVTTSCTCSAAEPRSVLIPAGQRRDMRLTLDLTAARSKAPDAEWRDFQVTIWPHLEGARKAGWTVSGRVHTAIRLEQPVLDLGRHSEAAQPLKSQKVYVTSYVPLEDLLATADASLLKVDTNRLGDNPQRFELVVSPSKLPVGPVETRITVTPQIARGVRVPGKRILVTGRIVPDFQASLPELAFGARQVGDVAEETLTLYSLTNKSFEVVAYKTEGGGLTVEKAALGEEGRPTFVLKQTIAALEHQEGRVVFQLRTRSRENTKLEVAVSYLGIPPTTH